ncbi:MAG: hypothetical protein ACOCR1_02425, partial [Planctomycetota bacterium]
MRGKVLMVFGVIVAFLMAGCGTPGWVQEGPGARKGRASVGVYGSGEGVAGASHEAQEALASLKARDAVAEGTREYVAGVMQGFVESNEDWFDMEQVEELELYESAADTVTKDNLARVEKVDQWTDDEEDKVFLLRYMPVDEELCQSMRSTFESVIQENSDDILQAPADDVMEGLEEYVSRFGGNPLGDPMAEAREKAEEEEKEMDEEKAEADEE